MSNTILIGICGQMGTGKDTIADRMVACNGYTKLSISTPMKEFVAKVFNFSHDQLYGCSSKRNRVDPRCFKDTYWEDVDRSFYIEYRAFCKKMYPQDPSHARFQLDVWYDDLKKTHRNTLTPRVVLQEIGTEWGQGLSRELWIDYTLAYVDKHPNQKFVISDVRFIHECQRVVDFGGKLIRLERDLDTESIMHSHLSEKEPAEVPANLFAASIMNNSNKTDLYNTLAIVVPALEHSCKEAFGVRHV